LRPFTFDRTFTFTAAPEELWAAFTRTGDFRRWWPWLREFSGDGLVPGGRSNCVVRAPVPYTLRFTVTVRALEPGRLVEAVVDGDLAGPARLEVGAGPAGDGGSTARLAWEMELRRPMLRAAARVGRPVMEWGHDWVVTTGVEQFLRRALGVQDGHERHHDPDPDRGPGPA
jgi:uncharacterized protein YndB with AHSA1/START domain